jgi:spoIIIJ-associated protein
MKKNLKSLAEKLLELLEIKAGTIEIKGTQTEGYQLNLQLNSQDTGILIGFHGDTIAALQLIINLLLYKQTGEWHKIIVNIGDYREKREQSLVKLAQDTKEKVKATDQPMALFNLNPFERRTVHTLLADDPDVETISEGEGRHRHLIIKPKT